VDDIARVPRPKDRARASYNRMSALYDVLTLGERRFQRTGLGLLAVQAGERVLEIGAGTGWACAQLAAAVGAEGGVLGVDIADRMLERAGRRLRRAGLAGRVELIRCDATALPCADAAFDAIYMSFTLELFDTPEIPTVLAECRRVLRPGGRIAVVALAREATFATHAYEALHRLLPATLDCRPIHPAAALDAAGLPVVTVRRQREWGLGVEMVLARSPEDGPLA